MADETETDDIIECWCGARGRYEELFDDSGLPPGGCGGTGTLHCECGGDQCVCHNHGEVDCPGCEDCEPDDGYAWDGDIDDGHHEYMFDGE